MFETRAETESAVPPIVPDPTQARQVKEFKHDRPLFACRFDPTGRFVFAGAQGNTIARWELATDQKATLTGHESWVRALAFARRREMLFTGDYAGQIIRWPYTDSAPKPNWSVPAHDGWVRALAVSPDEQLLASAGNDHVVRLWSVEHGTLTRELAGHDCHVYHTLFDPTGLYLMSADLRGRVKHWDVTTGKLVRELSAAELYKYDGGFRADIGGIRGMAFSSDGRMLACTGITEVTNAFAGVGKPLVILIDWHTGQRKAMLRPKDAYQGVAWGVCMHPSGFVIAVGGGGGGGILWFWRPDQEVSFHAVKLPNTAYDLALHPEGSLVATAHYDGALRIQDMSPKS